MRKDFGPQTYLYPMPVLIVGSYDEYGMPNAMNAAWGGICDFNQIAIALSQHKSTENIIKSKAFTISIGTVKMVTACDYVGIVSQNKVFDKFERSGFTAKKSSFVNAPIINELPMTLECELISYDEKTEILKGKIVNVSADEEILTNGEIDVFKLNPITYDPVNKRYISLGNVIADAFSEGKKLK